MDVAVKTRESPGQALDELVVNDLGTNGTLRFTEKNLYPLRPHAFTARTLRGEVTKVLLKETVMVLVPCPLTMVIPNGATHS